MLAIALTAPLYMAVVATLNVAGYSLLPLWVSLPTTLLSPLIVMPGSILCALGVHVFATSGSPDAPPSPWDASAVGAFLGVLNIAPSVLLGLLLFHLKTPWKYGWQGLWGEWLARLPEMVLHGAPVAIICGALLGGLIGGLRR